MAGRPVYVIGERFARNLELPGVKAVAMLSPPSVGCGSMTAGCRHCMGAQEPQVLRLATEECVWEKGCPNLNVSRCRATLFNNGNTQDMARQAFASYTGGRCHLVGNRLGHIKLPPNREVDEGVQSNSLATKAYRESHGFVEEARGAV